VDIYFNDASNQKEFRVRILLVSLEVAHTPFSIKIGVEVINNMVECKARFIMLQAAIK